MKLKPIPELLGLVLYMQKDNPTPSTQARGQSLVAVSASFAVGASRAVSRGGFEAAYHIPAEIGLERRLLATQVVCGSHRGSIAYPSLA